MTIIGIGKRIMEINHQHFLDKINKSSDDDTAKLIYADWLEEQGDRRGELIRINLAIKNHPDFYPRRRLTGELALLLKEYMKLLGYAYVTTDWKTWKDTVLPLQWCYGGIAMSYRYWYTSHAEEN